MVSIRRHRGFSILMALGIIAVLMIMVTGVAVMYMREFKLSRLSYDEIISNASAEWAFEYAMLKIKNHADGFQDSMTGWTAADSDVDWSMFTLVTPRSEGMNIHYEIQANTWSSTPVNFDLKSWQHLILPLFIDKGKEISAWKKSKKPEENTSDLSPTEGIDVWINGSNNNNVYWTISAINKNTNENIGLQGKWSFNASTNWTTEIIYNEYYCTTAINTPAHSCSKNEYDNILEDFWDPPTNTKRTKEVLEVKYLLTGSVMDFMEKWVKNFGNSSISSANLLNVELISPYLILYNSWSINDIASNVNIWIKSTSPFTLPQYTITATASKWDASQVFRFSEDKSKYYDYLKYWYYATCWEENWGKKCDN